MIARKAGPALASGCTLVIKPAEQTPLSALALAVLGERAGVPKGVFNVITGSPVEIGGELTSNPIVRKLSFTGSTEVGKLLMAQCAGTIKKISLELGGNAPFIVFDDADIDAAIEGATASKYRNTGQTCISTNRFYVQDAIYDAFAAKLTRAVKNLKPASGLEAGATQGPLIDDAALAKVETHLNDAKSKGAKVLIGGNRHSLGGRFFEPTVLADVTPQMRISKEETFGPVAPLFRFKNEAEAVALANDTEFGLAAYFYGRDIARIFRVAEALEYGIVGINTGMISTEVAPFGGFKESGLGREGSKYGMDDYLEVKYLCFGGISYCRSALAAVPRAILLKAHILRRLVSPLPTGSGRAVVGAARCAPACHDRSSLSRIPVVIPSSLVRTLARLPTRGIVGTTPGL